MIMDSVLDQRNLKVSTRKLSLHSSVEPLEVLGDRSIFRRILAAGFREEAL